MMMNMKKTLLVALLTGAAMTGVAQAGTFISGAAEASIDVVVGESSTVTNTLVSEGKHSVEALIGRTTLLAMGTLASAEDSLFAVRIASGTDSGTLYDKNIVYAVPGKNDAKHIMNVIMPSGRVDALEQTSTSEVLNGSQYRVTTVPAKSTIYRLFAVYNDKDGVATVAADTYTIKTVAYLYSA